MRAIRMRELPMLVTMQACCGPACRERSRCTFSLSPRERVG
jgi:hypothetical protein